MTKVLMAFEHFPVSTGRYVSEALRRLRHDVRTVGFPHGDNTGWGRKAKAEYIHTPYATLATNWVDWVPDLIIITDPRVPKGWRHGTYHYVPHVVYNTCNNVTNLEHESKDHFFLAHKHANSWPWVDDGKHTWLPNAHDPIWHTPSPIPFSERTYDAAFVGALHPDRKAVVEALRQDGYLVKVEHGPIFREYTDIYHDARIAIVTTTHGHSGASMRFFENAAHGCLVLAGPCADKDDLNPDGIVWFENANEARTKAAYYLQNPDEAEHMIARSMEWVRPHTWDDRAAKIIEWLEKRG